MGRPVPSNQSRTGIAAKFPSLNGLFTLKAKNQPPGKHDLARGHFLFTSVGSGMDGPVRRLEVASFGNDFKRFLE
jgi:hypothetical protein